MSISIFVCGELGGPHSPPVKFSKIERSKKRYEPIDPKAGLLLLKSDTERLHRLGFRVQIELGGYELARHPAFLGDFARESALYEIALLDVFGEEYIKASKTVTALDDDHIIAGRYVQPATAYREALIAEHRQEIADRFLVLVHERLGEPK